MIDNSKEIKLSIFDRIFRTKKWEKEHDRRAIVSYAYCCENIEKSEYFECFEQLERHGFGYFCDPYNHALKDDLKIVYNNFYKSKKQKIDSWVEEKKEKDDEYFTKCFIRSAMINNIEEKERKFKETPDTFTEDDLKQLVTDIALYLKSIGKIK